MKKILVVGAGFSGAVIAHELATQFQLNVVVVDEREHLAGNCHTERDSETGIMVHKYGPHIFHTSRKEVWDYIRQFGEFGNFTNRVKAITQKGIFSLPINLQTINQFFNKRFTPAEARTFLATLGDSSISTPTNFEEQALRFVGRELYEAFFYGYTKKQWGCEPALLPASILQRLPVRFNYDDNYYNDLYQGIPLDGYSAIIEKILSHHTIELQLGTSWNPAMSEKFDHVVFTGPIDQYYNYQHGRLGYRTVFWEKQSALGDFQGNAVINYPEISIPYTRIHEHKHFAPWEKHEKTIAFTEYSKETGPADVPYYPKRLSGDLEIFDRYRSDASLEKNVSFLGRLATYRYLDMHQVIGEAIDFAPKLGKSILSNLPRPIFPEA